jgi:hypothetical protein
MASNGESAVEDALNILENLVELNGNLRNEVNTMWTGDANLRLLRFCFTTVKDGQRKIAF